MAHGFTYETVPSSQQSRILKNNPSCESGSLAYTSALSDRKRHPRQIRLAATIEMLEAHHPNKAWETDVGIHEQDVKDMSRMGKKQELRVNPLSGLR